MMTNDIDHDSTITSPLMMVMLGFGAVITAVKPSYKPTNRCHDERPNAFMGPSPFVWPEVIQKKTLSMPRIRILPVRD